MQIGFDKMQMKRYTIKAAYARKHIPVPKRLFPRIMSRLRRIELQAPVGMLDVVVKDVAGTGASVIATRTMSHE